MDTLKARGDSVNARWSREKLEDIATDLFADDCLPLDDATVALLALLPLKTVEQYFLSGGTLPAPPAPYSPPSVSLDASIDDISVAMQAAGRIGLLEITGLPVVPLVELQAVFDDLHQTATSGGAPHGCYPNGLGLKDAYASSAASSGKDDMKRILDLNPRTLAEAEASLGLWQGAAPVASAFGAVVNFWREMADAVAPKLRRAVAAAASCDALLEDEHYDFRMVDYYQRSRTESAPRCRAHRDFGGFTLVFASTPGLQAQLDGGGSRPHASGDPGEADDDDDRWHDVAPSAPGSALLLFGWCTQIRSNGRLHAAQHRVVDAVHNYGPAEGHELSAVDGVQSARRSSAVFFVSPNDMQAPLEPAVLPGETCNYVPGKSAEAQMMFDMSNPLARLKAAAGSRAPGPV
jgi:hypothetical protein